MITMMQALAMDTCKWGGAPSFTSNATYPMQCHHCHKYCLVSLGRKCESFQDVNVCFFLSGLRFPQHCILKGWTLNLFKFLIEVCSCVQGNFPAVRCDFCMSKSVNSRVHTFGGEVPEPTPTTKKCELWSSHFSAPSTQKV